MSGPGDAGAPRGGRARGILIAGTCSDAGKSVLVAGLCRILARRGVLVAPYKAQNMSNNSMICLDGAEIGRAQYLQAQAAGVEATSAMNPVLLKPGTDRRSYIVARGQPAGRLDAGEYVGGRTHLAEAAFEAYDELAAQYEMIVCEGAGSPAEVNLRDGDYVNLGLARRFDLPVVVVGDIDRGGMLASLYGTWALLEAADRQLLAAFVVNKFRGDVGILRPGLDEITKRTGVPFLGVVPWLDGVWLDGEDALEVGRWRGSAHAATAPLGDPLRVAVVRFPRISNSTDVDALAAEAGVEVAVTTSADECAAADLVVLPGTRSTVPDLRWLRERGIAEVLERRAAERRPVLGICGGYQMLADTLDDEVESGAGHIGGLGLLPLHVSFGADKVLRRPSGQWRGHPVTGYEIHHGRVGPVAGAGLDPFLGGWRRDQVWGTLWHGALECDDFRRAWLAEIARGAGRDWRPDPAVPGYTAQREHMLDLLADTLERHVDVDALFALAW